MITDLRKKGIYHGFVVLYVIFTFSVGIISANIIPGIQIFTNKSGSMNPSIDTGSIIIVKKQDYYDVGDAVSYSTLVDGKETIITHRIVSIGGNVYVTKGDANVAVDRAIILPRLIIGKVVVIIPYVGYILSWVKSSFGVIFAIMLPASAIIMIELISIIKAL
jgi:signal peptidase